ncbi:MAG: HAD family hydrolase [Ferruginibacter sp.]
MKIVFLFVFVSFLMQACRSGNEQLNEKKEFSGKILDTTDPLPSWNEGDLKKSIIEYVTQVCDSTSKKYVPVTNRIATFDNDGTLWAEKPLVQELFAFYRVKKMVQTIPTLAKKQPFKAVLENDKEYFHKGGEKVLMELVIATHTGMTEDDFEKDVNEFIISGTYPGRNVSFKNITYQPQIELLQYLRANGFKTFICSGGTVELIRSISQDFYGIPKDQVIGSSFKYVFLDSNSSILRQPSLNSFDDKGAKPANIQLHIGQRPIFACGNEGGGGDIAMLKYSQASKYPSFQLIVNHNDSTREYFYQEKDSASLKAAAKNSWHVVSMKDDWKKVFKD